MNRKLVLISVIIFSCFLLAGCGKKVKDVSQSVTVEQETKNATTTKEPEAETSTKEPETSANTDDLKTKEESQTTDELKTKDDNIAMSIYTEAPNKNSSIKIQYPKFSDNDTLNTMIYEKVQSFAKIDTSLFSGDASLNINYQSEVTLKNNKLVSIIFWGPSYIDDAAYPTNDLITLNIDLLSMKEITLKDLYTTNTDFETVFFKKAFFPENPITSYDKESFPEMLKLQSPEYQTVDPFRMADNISFFLKPDGIVLSMPATHATGSDHFEAQLNYSDIQQFYLPKQNYWEDK
jgi:predicted small secreted protein